MYLSFEILYYWNSVIIISVYTSPPRCDLGTLKVCGSIFTAKPVSISSAHNFFLASNRSMPLIKCEFVHVIWKVYFWKRAVKKIKLGLRVQSCNIIQSSIFVHHIKYWQTKLSCKKIIIVIVSRTYLQYSSSKIFINMLWRPNYK